jgi:CubicO group peptidase (beta-lactamase class C family)
MYSMTKPMASVAAMMLIEEGKMQLNDPISKFLPAMKTLQVAVAKTDAEYAKTTYTLVPADREITVQDLMRHTSGLLYANLTQNAAVKDAYVKGSVDDDVGASTGTGSRAALEGAAGHQPGTVWEYSLHGHAGPCHEAASGKAS